MIHPKFWLKHAKARRALNGYPLYAVPHKQAEGTLSEQEAQENFDYLMRVRLQRLAFFQRWLRENFGVNATLDGDGLRAVSRWVDDYGGGLIGDSFDRRMETLPQYSFGHYQPLWEGAYTGYNVMIDLGIFLGEYLIAKRPRLHWDIYRGHEVEPATFESIGYMRPHLGGMPRGWGGDVLTIGMVIAGARENSHIRLDRPPAEKNVLIRRVRGLLYCARQPDGDGPFMFGDSKNEPL